MLHQLIEHLRFVASGWFAILLLLFVAESRAQKQTWRFGFEDTWSQFGGLLSQPQKDSMMARLKEITVAQEHAGDVNINGTAGGWDAMQPAAGAEINFQQSDALVQTLQKGGFSMAWNIRTNAEWATASSPTCRAASNITSCAPGPEFEDDLYDYIYAVIERYDGDGLEDMGFETPEDTSDDLTVPIQFYIMTGEIEFAGATPPPGPNDGYGDLGDGRGFWSDDVQALLRTHRIIYRAIHDADPTGFSKLVSSGGVFWDLYTDFPDYPQIDGPILRSRLEGTNNHNAPYVNSIQRVKQMLDSFGDDSDGIECDYIGWHPHMAWRDIDQSFAFIKRSAPNLPIYVDDMWANIFLQDRVDATGNRLFHNVLAGGEGDFPNQLVGDYSALRSGVIFNNNPDVRRWYLERGARQLVKAFASAFGEGAEYVCFSGTADFAIDRLSLTGFMNLLGTANENFNPKPAAFAMQYMVETLHDFTAVNEVPVSSDPRTRCYRFERAERGPVYVMWSETATAPNNLDYTQLTGQQVELELEHSQAKVRTLTGKTENVISEPVEAFAESANFTFPLGYSPIFVEPFAKEVSVSSHNISQAGVKNLLVLPQPVIGTHLTIEFDALVLTEFQAEIYDVFGRSLGRLTGTGSPGQNRFSWNLEHTRVVNSGWYVIRLCSNTHCCSTTVNLVRK